MSTSYEKLKTILRETGTLRSIGALLGWDQETMMPSGGATHRAEQVSLIARLAHRRFTDNEVGELLAACEADEAVTSDPRESANLRAVRRDYERATKLPGDLVAELTRTGVLAVEAWKSARRASDFESFRPWLEKQIELNRRKAECYGIPEGGEIYDALMEDYEPGLRAADLERILGPLREALSPLIRELASSPGARSETVLNPPVALQAEFNRRIAQAVGFDFETGRLDVSTHPFTEGVAPGDTRITTRYEGASFLDAMYSTLHEAGHALYEQGLPKAERPGEPLSQPAGLGLHESQSRMWENQVGRSRAFWSFAHPLAREIFGEEVDRSTADDLYRAANRVRPHLIRVESDETTYNLHIMLRFEIERALLRGDLAVADVPGVWNEHIKRDLGLDVPDDRRGCLQDIHWSSGAIGYFPTYTLGNLYAAQMWEVIARRIPDLDDRMARGEFGMLLSWLRENVHAHGRRYLAPELCERITGKPLDHRPLVAYLEAKLRPICDGTT